MTPNDPAWPGWNYLSINNSNLGSLYLTFSYLLIHKNTPDKLIAQFNTDNALTKIKDIIYYFYIQNLLFELISPRAYDFIAEVSHS